MQAMVNLQVQYKEKKRRTMDTYCEENIASDFIVMNIKSSTYQLPTQSTQPANSSDQPATQSSFFKIKILNKLVKVVVSAPLAPKLFQTRNCLNNFKEGVNTQSF
jgi:hypothetical protein